MIVATLELKDRKLHSETPSKEEPKKFMTNRQLVELMAKGYGEWSFNTEELDFHTEIGYGILNDDKEVEEDILIRPWGSKELRKPTVDIYEEYVSKWNRAFSWVNELTKGENKSESRPQDCPQSSGIKDYSDASYIIEPSIGERFLYKGKLYECIESYDCSSCAFVNGSGSCFEFRCTCNRRDGKGVNFVDVSEKENTNAFKEPSSAEGECGGVHKRTPQEIADFFGCYVAMDEDGSWHLFTEEPSLITDVKEIWMPKNSRIYIYLFINDAFLSKPNPIDWRTLYRPHQKPIVTDGKGHWVFL